MIIQGHRGGFAPGNSLEVFQKAIENGVQSIELDVWLTKDNELVVVHGGDSGEINFASFDENSTVAQGKQYVFELTLDENRSTEPTFVMPTLREVFELAGRRTFLNIEMKVPYLEEPRSRYNVLKATELTHRLIQDYDLADYCFISSFNHGDVMLRNIDNLNEQTGYHVRTVYLYNFYPETVLPSFEEIVRRGDGINISYEHLTQELVSFCHAHKKLVCVWIDTTVTTETLEMYKRLIDLGVDLFCSDWPLEVTKLRDSLMSGIGLNKLKLPKAMVGLTTGSSATGSN